MAPAAVGIGLSAVLAAAVWLGLLAARRKKGRRRPTGKQPVMVSLQAARVERRIRERAGTRDVMWMDNALRYAATLSAGRDTADLPDVTCVWLSDTELQLQLAAPAAAPAPFTAEGDSWVLPVTADIPAPGEDWTDPAAPFPLLTSVGDLDGETLLVDFERLGAVSLTGDAGPNPGPDDPPRGGAREQRLVGSSAGHPRRVGAGAGGAEPRSGPASADDR